MLKAKLQITHCGIFLKIKDVKEMMCEEYAIVDNNIATSRLL